MSWPDTWVRPADGETREFRPSPSAQSWPSVSIINATRGTLYISLIPGRPSEVAADYLLNARGSAVMPLNAPGVRILYRGTPDATDSVGVTIFDTPQPASSAVPFRAETAGAVTLPVGGCIEWFSTTVPPGYLECNFQAVSRALFPDLDAIAAGMSYAFPWGLGDGSTTFNVPDKRGHVSVQRDIGDPDFGTFGARVGAKTVTLTLAQTPSHSHTVDAHSHTISASGTHIHQTSSVGSQFAINTFAASPVGAGGFADVATFTDISALTTGPGGNHDHGGFTGSATPGTSSVGSGQAHSNIQPTQVGIFIVRAL